MTGLEIVVNTILAIAITIVACIIIVGVIIGICLVIEVFKMDLGEK